MVKRRSAERARHGVPSFPARLTDPETSQMAAAKQSSDDIGRFSTNSLKGRVFPLFKDRKLTADEAADELLGLGDPQYETCRRRVSDLVKAGFIAPTGNQRSNHGRSAPADVYAITALGAWALKNLEEFGWTR